jgi:NAD(P)-dependent dehydrogenase (short-subunit alcohol dehydrogenase family)
MKGKQMNNHQDSSSQRNTAPDPEKRNLNESTETRQGRRGISRRRFLRQPAAAGASLWALNALGVNAFADGDQISTTDIEPAFDEDQAFQVRHALGIVIVGASSGLGAELARQYADHGAYIVLAARRTAKLQEVAADVSARGGVPHIITTDVRDETQCQALVENAIGWLATQGKVIDILALAPIRAQACPIGPDMSTEVLRNVIETNYFGPVNCLKHAVPHLKANKSTVFYFNSITASVPLPTVVGYTTSKHAWRGVMNTLKFENPELTVVSSYFNAVNTEAWHKELTCFNTDTRYCPSLTKTYLIPEENMYPEPVAVAKIVSAIETQTPEAFLSKLNKAAWMIGFSRVELGLFLTMLENSLGWRLVQRLESEIRQAFKGPGTANYAARLLRKLGGPQANNELVDAARYLLSADKSIALYLLAFDDLLDEAAYAAAKQAYDSYRQSLADGSLQGLELLLSSGTLSPSGIAADNDGLAPVTSCPRAV